MILFLLQRLEAEQHNLSFLNYEFFFANCTIGRTSRATFGIPAERSNITICPILSQSLF